MKKSCLILLTVVLTLAPCLAIAQSSTPDTSSAAAALPASAPAAPSLTDDSTKPAAPNPVVGDPVNTVFTALGRPNGVMTMPDKSNVLIYDRGTVLIADGKVSEMKLMSLVTYNAKLAAEAAAEADRQVNIARSNALLQMLLADPTYKDMPTADRMSALHKFDREYPGSDAAKYLSDLSVVYSVELMKDAKISNLENELSKAKAQYAAVQQQVADAQKKVTDAEQSAVTANSQSDLARQQAALAQNQLTTNPPLTLAPNSNVPHSLVGPGGVVLIPNSSGTTPPPAAGSNPSASGNSPAPAASGWVMGPDGLPHFVNTTANGTTGN